ncbi:MAG: hypothetical protein AAF360_02705 [Pseudomonadota bacterium]
MSDDACPDCGGLPPLPAEQQAKAAALLEQLAARVRAGEISAVAFAAASTADCFDDEVRKVGLLVGPPGGLATALRALIEEFHQLPGVIGDAARATIQ